MNPFAELAREVLDHHATVLVGWSVAAFPSDFAGVPCAYVYMVAYRDRAFRGDLPAGSQEFVLCCAKDAPYGDDTRKLMIELTLEWQKRVVKWNDPLVALHVLAGGAP